MRTERIDPRRPASATSVTACIDELAGDVVDARSTRSREIADRRPACRAATAAGAASPCRPPCTAIACAPYSARCRAASRPSCRSGFPAERCVDVAQTISESLALTMRSSRHIAPACGTSVTDIAVDVKRRSWRAAQAYAQPAGAAQADFARLAARAMQLEQAATHAAPDCPGAAVRAQRCALRFGAAARSRSIRSGTNSRRRVAETSATLAATVERPLREQRLSARRRRTPPAARRACSRRPAPRPRADRR